MENSKIIIRDTTRRGIDEAVSYVAKNWFPVNRELIKQIQKKISDGVYQDSVKTFIADLKNDLALYTWTMMHLKEVIGREETGKSPDQILASLNNDKIKALFSSAGDQISIHTFSPEAKAQTVCLKHALVSCSTAEVLAEKTDLTPDAAFATASLRQLGINLVAWNYPRIYNKALDQMASTKGDLEQALFKVLGYSPLQLGLKTAAEWCCCSDFREAAGFADESKGKEKKILDPDSMAGKLRRFCEIGEAMARINDPEHFPNASSEWENVSKQITRYIGPQGITLIGQKLEKNSSVYQDLSPALFRVEVSPEKCLRIAKGRVTNKLFDANNYIKRCPEQPQERFRYAYSAMTGDGPSPVALNNLVAEVIPLLGFTNGCVYLYDDDKMLLVPMLKIGDAPLSRYRPLTASDPGVANHPAVIALSYSAPIIQEGAIVNGEQVSHITGTFGTRERQGVLYLEMNDSLTQEPDRTTPLVYFKAVRQCLNDCLNLRQAAV